MAKGLLKSLIFTVLFKHFLYFSPVLFVSSFFLLFWRSLFCIKTDETLNTKQIFFSRFLLLPVIQWFACHLVQAASVTKCVVVLKSNHVWCRCVSEFVTGIHWPINQLCLCVTYATSPILLLFRFPHKIQSKKLLPVPDTFFLSSLFNAIFFSVTKGGFFLRTILIFF